MSNEKQENIVRHSTGAVFNSVEELARAMTTLGERYNLVGPGGAMGVKLPLLHAAGMSFVIIDPEKETYPIVGSKNLGISKGALDRIAAAAGVRWNPHFSGRADDGSNAHVVEYQAAGTVLQLDGTERMILASKRIDLRAEKDKPVETWGSDAQEIARIAAKQDPPRDPWPQILQARQHILSLAETKAKNRAIRTLGVRTSYEPAELAKGFLVTRLQFTGRSDDPEVEREVSIMIARRALSSAGSLYGADAEGGQASRTVPKIIAREAELVEDEPEGKKAVPPPASAPAAAPPAKPAVPEPKKNPEKPPLPKSDPLLICGPKDSDDNWPRKLCSQFTIKELENKIAATEKKKPTWEARWVRKNQDELDAMNAWLAILKAGAAQQGLDDGLESEPDEVPF